MAIVVDKSQASGEIMRVETMMMSSTMTNKVEIYSSERRDSD